MAEEITSTNVRQQLQHHHVFNLVAGAKLFYAPIDKPARVLDAGTGTGIWAIDFAE
jgi:ubiquinone/menaquinone biosynthesis C-methylase UbiE